MPAVSTTRLRSPQGFLVWVIVLAMCGGAVGDEAARREFFEARIRPVLAAECYSCHGARKQQGGLRLDWREGWMKGGYSGPAVEPGQPDDSLLVLLIEHQDVGEEMPKGSPKLSEATIRDFRDWIADGAFDPRNEPPSAEESDRIAWQAKLAERRTWWSLQPPTRPAVPVPRRADWSREPVDRFLLARLEAEGLTPAPPADPDVLARRLAFVLTGMPPDPRTLSTFLDNPAPDAYERLVDRLLASPRFGERWARHWMDVVRFGDTYGYEWDIPAKGAWRYRDYLVRAFNADVPFDQLVREQIAGDLLDAPRINATEADQRVADRPDVLPARREAPRRQRPVRRHSSGDAAQQDRRLLQGIPGPHDRLRPLPRPQARRRLPA